jgi:hypothetical protein
MGLLTKTNPKATWQTVVRHSVVTSLVGTCMYASILWWNGWWRDLPIKLSICAMLLLFVGALWEWQVPDNDEPTTEPIEPLDTSESAQHRL